MLVDCQTLTTGSEVEVDVCVVGAGPAAISLALALDASAVRVALFERGGLPGRPHGLTKIGAQPVDSDFDPPVVPDGRFGGGANEWIVRLPWNSRGVRMVPLMPADLEARPWVEHSGWPLEWSELERFYRRAHGQLGLDRFGYTVADWEDAAHPRLPLEPFGFTTAMERFPHSTVLTGQAFDTLRRSRNVTIHLHGSVGAIDGDADRVRYAEIDAGGRDRLRVTAQVFVLAAGGLDNPRLLLAARSGAGYGNTHDVVGRYYMDHLRVRTGSLVPHWPTERYGLYDLHRVGHVMVMGKLTPTNELLRTEALLNSGAMILPTLPDDVRADMAIARSLIGSPSWSAARAAARVARVIGPIGPRMSWYQRRFPPRVDAGWSRLGRATQRFGPFSVEHQIEQAPDPHNRVVLGQRHDEHGRSTLDICWRWGDLDLQSLRATQHRFAAACAAAGIGEFLPAGVDESLDVTTPGGSFHPSGGTRMHDDPKRGVTDHDGRVHGVANLFVAGSSTFPTVGYANPTFTIVALAIRLAQTLRRELGASIAVDGASGSAPTPVDTTRPSPAR
ncbi:MAG: GMC oxidoreductase [Ilumatobacteraceae bacterium]